MDRQLLRRSGARVLVVDVRDRLLLVRAADPSTPQRPFWFTVGGGIEPGETARAAAVRELREETGYDVAESDLVGPVVHDHVSFPFDHWWIEQRNAFFGVRVHGPPQGFPSEAPEVAALAGTAWWTLDELRAQAAGAPHGGPGRPGEPLYPPTLGDVLAATLAALRAQEA